MSPSDCPTKDLFPVVRSGDEEKDARADVGLVIIP